MARKAVAGVASVAVVLSGLWGLILLSPTASAAGDFVWTRQFGTPGYDYVVGVAIDASGFYVGGATNGSFPGQSNAGGYDAFLRKLDASGNIVWTIQFGTSNDDYANALAADATGVYVAGQTAGNLPGQTSAGGWDALIRKYDTGGNLLWTRQFGTSGADYGVGVGVDPSGVYVVGSTSGTFPGQTTAGNDDGFIQKYDTGGNLLWTRQFGTSDYEYANRVAFGASGLYLAGAGNGTFSGQSNAGGFDAFLLKYDASGNVLWTRQFGTSGRDSPMDVAVDESGAYVSGVTDGTLPGQSNAGGFDAFLGKYDASGNVLWTRQFGTSGGDSASAVAGGPSGVYVGGETNGLLPGQTSAGGYDAFLQKYDLSGNVLWTRQFGSSASDSARAVDVSATGMAVAGWTQGTIPGQSSAGGIDGFLGRFGEQPGAPENLQAAPGDDQVTLSWQAPMWDGGLSITTYRVYRGTTTGSQSFLADVGPSLTYVDSAVTNGVTYYYDVTAVNAMGEGPVSTETSATPNPPVDTTKPTITITSPAGGAVLAAISVAVAGTASDNVGLLRVELSADGTNWITATGTAAWAGQLTLVEGTNTIYARATDTADNTQTVSVEVTVQSSSPSAAGIPVWVWPLIAVVAVAILLAFLLVRKRRGPQT